jgi:hypothetical protein
LGKELINRSTKERMKMKKAEEEGRKQTGPNIT